MAKKAEKTAQDIIDTLEAYRNVNHTDPDPRSKETQVLHIPLTKAEHKEFKAEAAMRDQSMAQYFRDMRAAFKNQ